MPFIPEFVESQHPRAGKGNPTGGQFVSKGGRPAREFQRLSGSPQRLQQRAQRIFQGGKARRNVQVFRRVSDEFAAKLDTLKPGTRVQRTGGHETLLAKPADGTAMRILLPKGTPATATADAVKVKAQTLIYEGQDGTNSYVFRATTGGLKPVAPKVKKPELTGVPAGTHPQTISVRLVTAKKAEAQSDRYLRVDLAAMKEDTTKVKGEDKTRFEHNIELLRDAAFYPNFRKKDLEGKTAAQIAEIVKKHIKENLLFLWHNATPEEMRARTWYEGVHKLVMERAEKYKLNVASVTGVYAALSPQKDWDENVYLADRVIEIYNTKKDFRWNASGPDVPDLSDPMEKTAKEIWVADPKLDEEKRKAKQELFDKLVSRIRGKTLGELTDPNDKAMWIRTYDEAFNDGRYYREFLPDGTMGDWVRHNDKKQTRASAAWASTPAIANAIISLESQGDRSIISDAMGEGAKVRSFYNNILDPWSPNGDVTIDTHDAYGAGLMRPLPNSSAPVLHGMGLTPKGKKYPGPSWKATSKSTLTGIDGLYGLYADAYRDAARELKVRPNELQAVVWTVKRNTLMSGKKKLAAEQEVEWRKYYNGSQSLNATRQAVLDIGRGKQELSEAGADAS